QPVQCEVAADEACAAGYKDGHEYYFLIGSRCSLQAGGAPGKVTGQLSGIAIVGAHSVSSAQHEMLAGCNIHLSCAPASTVETQLALLRKSP
ncbi:MAG: hypothetical protein V4627_08855, partial [Pseudomonadota bacterium]